MVSHDVLRTREITLRHATDSAEIFQFHFYFLAVIILLYFALSPPALLLFGWQYLGGGNQLEKIHPATYMLASALCFSFLIDARFRRNIFVRVASDPSIAAFILAFAVTACYAVISQGASAAPFVDTFIAAILAVLTVSYMPRRPLIFLRRLLDIFFIISIGLLLWEFAAQRDFLLTYVLQANQGPNAVDGVGLLQASTDFGRPSALFGHPLSAATLLAVYSISNLTSVPMRFSRAAIGRLSLALLSYIAIFPTGGREAIIATTILLISYLVYSTITSASKGYVNVAGFTFAILAAALSIPICLILWSYGFFDTMLSRFEFDNGSALARDYALRLIEQASTWHLWFGRPVQDVLAAQRAFGLIAIEISWANFILVCGLIATIPLFVTYVLFLFRSISRLCMPGVYFVSTFILIDSASSNGIWTKTTALTTSLVVAMCLLRRDTRAGHRIVDARDSGRRRKELQQWPPSAQWSVSMPQQATATTTRLSMTRDADKSAQAQGLNFNNVELDDIELNIPRTRRYSPIKIFHDYARRVPETERVILAGFVLGLSSRKVEEALQTLGRPIAPSVVSQVSKMFDAAVTVFHDRPLALQYKALMLGGVVLTRKTGASVLRRVALVALGLTPAGKNGIIDFRLTDSASAADWQRFLTDLCRRGLTGERLDMICVDGGSGLLAALPAVFPDIAVQRCWTHEIRGLLDKVGKADRLKVKRALYKIMNAPNAPAAHAAARRFAERFDKQYPALVACLRNDLDALLTCFRYKSEPQRRAVRTTNALERLLREVQRRTRSIVTFQDMSRMDRILLAVFTHEGNSPGVSDQVLLTQNYRH